MIPLTRLDGRDIVVNCDLIVTVESTPDTLLRLTTGDRILIKDSVEDVVSRVLAFRRRVLESFPQGAAQVWARPADIQTG